MGIDRIRGGGVCCCCWDELFVDGEGGYGG